MSNGKPLLLVKFKGWYICIDKYVFPVYIRMLIHYFTKKVSRFMKWQPTSHIFLSTNG